MLRLGGDGSQFDHKVRPVLGDPCLVGKSLEGLAAAGWGDSNSTSLSCVVRGQEALGLATCGYDQRVVTASVRCCPWFALRLRTQHGPRPVADASGAPVLRRQGQRVHGGANGEMTMSPMWLRRFPTRPELNRVPADHCWQERKARQVAPRASTSSGRSKRVVVIYGGRTQSEGGCLPLSARVLPCSPVGRGFAA
jgi:hypothetical protein